MRGFINPLLFWAAHSRRAALIRQIQYLKVENEILRSRLPKLIVTKPHERERLIRYAKRVGPAIKDVVSIVKPTTLMRWLSPNRGKKGPRPRKPGRPRTPADLEALIIRIARETGWGYTRILGELKKLRVGSGVSRSTVVNILKRAGLDPSPERKKATWDEFIKRHAETLWACDFMPRKILTLRGWREAFVLVFINLKTRKAWVSPSTLAPSGEWTADQTRLFLNSSTGGATARRLVMHDNDTRFQVQFQAALAAHKAESIRLQLCSPNLNAYAERFIQTLQQECLDHFVIFGCRHMDHLVREFLEHYHTERPHQSLGNQPLVRDGPLTSPLGEHVACDSRLGGVLKHYRRAA